MKAQRILSALLTAALLLGAAAALPLTGAAASTVTTITDTNPVITAEVGDTVVLSLYQVEADNGSILSADNITWTLDGETVSSVHVTEKGVQALTAKAGNVTETVYLVSKNPDEEEYVLYENEFDGTLADLEAEGWVFPRTTHANKVSVSDGVLHLGDKNYDYYRAILPEWLGDFGDYAISIRSNQTNVKDAARWTSIVYRIENANGNYYPYYHMCVRANTTSNTLEFAERTTSNGWNVIYTSSEGWNMTDAGYHTLTVRAFENTVQYLFDDEHKMFVSDASAHTKGFVGLNCNFGTMNVDSIRITVQESAPQRPPVTPMLVDSSVNRTETNITSYVSNQAYITVDEFDTLMAADSYPVAALLDVTGMTLKQEDFEKYLTGFAEKNIIPQFKMDAKTQVDVLNNAVKATKVPEVMVVSADAAVVKYARTKNKTVIRGAVDYSAMDAERISKSDIHELYDTAAGAYAQAIIVPYQLATKENVAAWQEFEVAVWAFGTGVDTLTEASWLVASGANAVISDNWTLVADVQTSVFTSNDAITRTPVWTAHRGYSSKYPENSLSACIGAYEVGADCIEIDVHLSSDGVVMVMHDESIDRTTNGTGSIANMTYEQLKKYRLKRNGVVTEESIPTFEEILQYFKGKDVKFLCEIKSSQSKLPKACADLVKKYGMEDQVVYISFFANQLTAVKQHMNTSTGYLLNATGFTDAADTVGTLNAYYAQQNNILNYHATMAINYGNMSAEFLRDAGDRGVTLWTWTYSLGASAMVNKMFHAGMNGMTTDDPQYLQNTVKTIKAPTLLYVLPDGTAKLKVESITYNGTVKDISGSASYTILENDGVISIAKDGTVSGLKEGTASFIVSYSTKLPDNSTYTLYTQPVTVTVGDIQELTLVGGSSFTLQDGILSGVPAETTLKTLLENIVNPDAVKVYAADGKEITSENAYIGHGTVISMNGIDTTVLVRGDINGDGKVNIADYTLTKRSVLRTTTLSDLQEMAADVNGDGKINIADYTLVKRHVLRTYNLYQ